MELKRTRIVSTILLLLCLVLYTSAFTIRHGEEQEREGEGPVLPKQSLWEIVKNGFSPYSSSPLKVTSYREKFKSLTGQLHAYFFPPNLDFKVTGGSDGQDRVEHSSSPGGDGGGGAGEKMKEAVSKSFEKSKDTVEDSAKSAAKAVGDTVQKTKEKVKKSFSEKEGHQPHEAEL